MSNEMLVSEEECFQHVMEIAQAANQYDLAQHGFDLETLAEAERLRLQLQFSLNVAARIAHLLQSPELTYETAAAPFGNANGEQAKSQVLELLMAIADGAWHSRDAFVDGHHALAWRNAAFNCQFAASFHGLLVGKNIASVEEGKEYFMKMASENGAKGAEKRHKLTKEVKGFALECFQEYVKKHPNCTNRQAAKELAANVAKFRNNIHAANPVDSSLEERLEKWFGKARPRSAKKKQ